MRPVLPALSRLKPKSIKHKLFAAFLLIVFVPLLLLQFSMYDKTEKLIRRKIGDQDKVQLEQMRQNFENAQSFMLRSVVTLEMMLNQQEIFAERATDEDERSRTVADMFRKLQDQQFPGSAFLTYTLLDLDGHVYAEGAAGADYSALRSEYGFRAIYPGKVKYVWVGGSSEDASSRNLLSLYAALEKESQMFALIRIEFRFEEWLRSIAKDFAVYQDYYIVDESGMTLASTRDDQLDPSIYRKIMAAGEGKPDFATRNAVISVGSLPSIHWTIVSSFPLGIYFGDLHEQQLRYLLTLIGILLAFIAITFFLLRRITRPLHLLERRMSEAVEQQFVKGINEKPYEGEILSLSRTFNRMLGDMQKLIEKIKRDEKQKEVLRFQNLLSVMNPHFLLNTLNTVKWLAIRKNEPEIADICVQLGKLLETSLNTDVELIRLKEELELIRAYERIQKNRFLHPFSIRYDNGHDLEYALLPKMSLQPLVENAIVHGFAGLEKEGTIEIRVSAERQHLVVEVADNGIGMEASAKAKMIRKRTSIGLSNLRERLHLLFKSEARLEVDSDSSGTRVRMVIPMLIAKPYHSSDS